MFALRYFLTSKQVVLVLILDKQRNGLENTYRRFKQNNKISDIKVHKIYCLADSI